jgi:drug/metabolite transporter (DMT)-like permease
MSSGGDRLSVAVGTLVFTVFALSLGDALIKRFSTDFTLWQIFVVRSVLALPLLIASIKLGFSGTTFWPSALGWTVLRSLMLCFMWVAYYAALPHVALSVAAAAFYTLPLFIILFAALFLGDRVGLKGWTAVFIGFFGVLLVLKPHTDDFNLYAVLPVISAILYALSMIVTRDKCRNENVLVLSLALNLCFVFIGVFATVLIAFLNTLSPEPTDFPFLLGPWSQMDNSEWLVMGMLTISILIGSIGTAIAYQLGPPSVLGTVDFAYVGFAALWGFILFVEIPDKITLSGMIFIVSAGVLAVKR